MSRPLQIEYPDAWYHIMNRGRRSENIFLNEKDYIFLTRKLRRDTIKEIGEQFERRYSLKAMGYDFEAVVKRVAKLLEIESNQVVTNSKKKEAVRARSLACY